MKYLYKILILTILLVFSGGSVFPQNVSLSSDTLKVVQKKTESKETSQNQVRSGNQGDARGQANSQNAAGAKPVKKINSARPDMSKAKGARPNIVRPSGSGMPKGAGKPGGAGHLKGR